MIPYVNPIVEDGEDFQEGTTSEGKAEDTEAMEMVTKEGRSNLENKKVSESESKYFRLSRMNELQGYI